MVTRNLDLDFESYFFVFFNKKIAYNLKYYSSDFDTVLHGDVIFVAFVTGSLALWRSG